MASVTLFNRIDPPVRGEVAEGPHHLGLLEAPRIKLRRSGKRPYSFDGMEVCSATSHAPGPSLWYEINLYRRSGGGLVVEIRFFSKVTEMKDRFTVFEAEDLDDVARILEAFDPAQHLDADMALHDTDHPVVEVALQAAVLRMRLDEARRQYGDLVGDVLYQLDA